MIPNSIVLFCLVPRPWHSTAACSLDWAAVFFLTNNLLFNDVVVVKESYYSGKSLKSPILLTFYVLYSVFVM